MTTRQVVVCGPPRPIGKFGGSLKDVTTVDLGSAVVRAAVARAGIDPMRIEQAFVGNVIHTDMRDMYLARVVAINGGLSIETPALTLNRVCGSGLQAIISAAQAILLGDCDVALAGGVESMSRAPTGSPACAGANASTMRRYATPWLGLRLIPLRAVRWGLRRRMWRRATV